MKKIIFRIIYVILFLISVKYLGIALYFWIIKMLLCNKEMFSKTRQTAIIIYYIFTFFLAFLIVFISIMFNKVRKKKTLFLKIPDFEFILMCILISFYIFFSPIIININNIKPYAELLGVMNSQLYKIMIKFHLSREINIKEYLKNNKDKLSIYDPWKELIIIDLEKELIISKGEDKLLNTNDDAFIQLPHFEPLSEECWNEMLEMKKNHPDFSPKTNDD